jgi:hypothetical protein
VRTSDYGTFNRELAGLSGTLASGAKPALPRRILRGVFGYLIAS